MPAAKSDTVEFIATKVRYGFWPGRRGTTRPSLATVHGTFSVLELRAAFRHSQGIDRSFFCFLMNPNLETIGQEVLQHRAKA